MFKAFFGSASALILTAALIAAVTFSSPVSAATKATVAANYGKLPLVFEPNRGQTDDQVKFLSRGRGYSLYLTKSEAVLSLRGADDKGQALRVKLLGAKPDPKMTGLDRLPGVSNYFIGRDRSKWRTGVPHYARVGYEGIYPGIDLVFYGTSQRRLEYDFVVAPGAHPSRIALSFEGAERLEIDAKGDLVAHLAAGEIRFLKPVIYQDENGKRQNVEGKYTLTDTNRVGFRIASYDPAKPLIIDPVLEYPTLAYSTFLGGNGEDDGRGIAVDSDGRAYVTGMTDSTNFPVTYLTEYSGARDVFVAKLSPDGRDLIYSTYLGGESSENAFDIAVDGAYNAYVTGDTQSNDFPVVSAFLESGSGAFVARLDPDGVLDYATYLDAGTGFGIAVKPGCPTAGELVCNIYVTGSSEANFPVTDGAFQTLPAGAFLAVLDPAPDTGGLVYGTFLGGSGGEVGYAIAVGGNGDAYLTGRTTSDDFPTTPNVMDPNCAHETVDNDCGEGGVGDTFVTVLRPANEGPLDLIYSSYLGGAIGSVGRDIAVMPGCESQCFAFVTGSTASVDFPTTENALLDGHAGSHSKSDTFVTVINTAEDSDPTNDLVYSTLFGGTGGLAIVADDLGRAYVAGHAASGSGEIPIRDAIYPDPSGVFVAVIDTDAIGAESLLFSTYLGSGSTWGIAADGDGAAYVIGSTGSEDFPTTANALQEELAFNEPNCSACQKNSRIRTLNLVTTVDAFVTKIAGPFPATNPGDITQVAVPIRPVAVDDLDYLAVENTPLTISAGDGDGLLDNDINTEGDPLFTAILIRNAVNGTVVFAKTEDGDADGGFVYTPNAGFAGLDHFAYAAFDGQAESNVAVAVIKVTNVIDDPPVATNDTYRVVAGQILTVIAPGVLANDTDIENDPLTADLVSGPANGMLSLNSDGSFTYTPNGNFSGTDTFAYKANDGSNDSVDPATVTITVVGLANLHVGDLDEIGSSLSGYDWRATVRIYVHDTLEQGVSEATVTGVWTDSVGYGNTVSCTIEVQLDYCDVGSGAIPSPIRKWSRANVTFTVTNISSEPLLFPYDATANHDADGDSDGTSITVFRPGPNK